METIATMIELVMIVAIIMLCGVSVYLYFLEIVKKIKNKFHSRA